MSQEQKKEEKKEVAHVHPIAKNIERQLYDRLRKEETPAGIIDLSRSIELGERKKHLMGKLQAITDRELNESLMKFQISQQQSALELAEFYHERLGTIKAVVEHLQPHRWKYVAYFILGAAVFGVIYYGWQAGWFKGWF